MPIETSDWFVHVMFCICASLESMGDETIQKALTHTHTHVCNFGSQKDRCSLSTHTNTYTQRMVYTNCSSCGKPSTPPFTFILPFISIFPSCMMWIWEVKSMRRWKNPLRFISSLCFMVMKTGGCGTLFPAVYRFNNSNPCVDSNNFNWAKTKKFGVIQVSEKLECSPSHTILALLNDNDCSS